ncbi:MAG: tetratricopeptide repeat protein [Prochloraceae cyanobacterium]
MILENLYAQARDSYYRGNNKKAIYYIKQYLRLDPRNGEIYNLQGKVYLSASKFEKALASFDRAINLAFKAKYYYNRAVAHQKLEEKSAAKKDFQKITELSDRDLETYYYCSKALNILKYKDYQDYDRLLSIQPKNAEEYYYRAYFNTRSGKIEAAISDYTRAIAFNPNYIDAYHGRAGLLEIELEDLKGALSDYNRIIELNPRHFYARVVRSMILGKMGRDEEAKLDLDRAIQIDPALGYFYRGNIKEGLEDFPGAIADYTDSIAANPHDAYVYYLRSCLWTKLEETDRAIADYDRIIALKTAKADNNFPDLKEIYRLRGTAKQKRGDIRSAISDFTESIHHNLDKDTYVYNLRAKLWIKVGNIDRAIFDYSESIDINPQDIEIYYQRAKLWLEQGQINKAIADLDRILAIKTAKPDSIDGNIIYGGEGDNYGYLIYGANNTNVTLKEVYQLREKLIPQQKLLDIKTEILNLNQFIRNNRDLNAYKYTMRAELLTKIGEIDKAIADYDASVRINPENTYTYYQRAKLWHKIGQIDRAIDDLDRILELKSVSEDTFTENEIIDVNRQNVYPPIADVYKFKYQIDRERVS